MDQLLEEGVHLQRLRVAQIALLLHLLTTAQICSCVVEDWLLGRQHREIQLLDGLIRVGLISEPGVAQALLGGWSLARVLRQQFLKKVNCILTDLSQCLMFVVGLLLGDHLHQPGHVLMVERLHSREHHEEHDTGAPDVDLLVVLSLGEYLWGAELDGACFGDQFLTRHSLS